MKQQTWPTGREGKCRLFADNFISRWKRWWCLAVRTALCFCSTFCSGLIKQVTLIPTSTASTFLFLGWTPSFYIHFIQLCVYWSRLWFSPHDSPTLATKRRCFFTFKRIYSPRTTLAHHCKLGGKHEIKSFPTFRFPFSLCFCSDFLNFVWICLPVVVGTSPKQSCGCGVSNIHKFLCNLLPQALSDRWLDNVVQPTSFLECGIIFQKS